MNKTILIIAALVAAIIGGGYYFINSNPKVKAQAEKFGILDAPPPTPVPPVHNSVFIVFDPSGSGNTSYSVPRIDTNYINQVISQIQSIGFGDLWLTYIDMNGSNNDVLHFSIPKPIPKLEPPVRKTGERTGDFNKRYAAFKQDSTTKVKEIVAFWESFNAEKGKFIASCQKMISTGYGPKKPGTDYSDCIGSINAAFRSLETIKPDTVTFRSLLLISDGEQSNRYDTPKQKLGDIPQGLTIVTVNHSGSKNNVLHGHCTEIDNLDRAMEYTIHKFKPLNQ